MFAKDVILTSVGKMEITFVGHGSLMLHLERKVIHVDPWSDVADYSDMPKADLVLITHEHRDHLDPKALDCILTPNSALVLTAACMSHFGRGIVMANGEEKVIRGLTIEAVPAYNIRHTRSDGQPFHPRGTGNGYVVTLGGKRLYVAGDTENTPEMRQLTNIDIAFLPMNLPYTMTPEMVAEAALAFRPRILYPYHYGDTDTSRLVDLLKQNKDIEVRLPGQPHEGETLLPL